MPIAAPLYSTDFTDCVLSIGDPEKPVKYEVHRHILCVQSPVFKAGLTNEKFKESTSREFSLPESSAAAMDYILSWMYKSPVELPNNMRTPEDYDLLNEILRDVDYLQVEDIKQELVSRISQYICISTGAAEARAATLRLLDAVYCHGGKLKEHSINGYLDNIRAAGRFQDFAEYVFHLEDPNTEFLQSLCSALFKYVDRQTTQAMNRNKIRQFGR
ncbi:hypothetical protein H072_199 [Dactylellina haptotyla CBS 200.50]|uniref:BTB domain-containing protein n=1 Tax=Dactylellina haptotyla (strain CBS 200.50) TaxID=1284197 RepID=S8ARY8_DACHA|nr:hypothetical protein H072_199 [Dactylellina haptotyla CBS 200.50]